MHTTCEVRGTEAMPRAKKSKDDEPSTLTPMTTETMRATTEVRGTKVIPRVTELATSQALSRRR